MTIQLHNCCLCAEGLGPSGACSLVVSAVSVSFYIELIGAAYVLWPGIVQQRLSTDKTAKNLVIVQCGCLSSPVGCGSPGESLEGCWASVYILKKQVLFIPAKDRAAIGHMNLPG